MRIKSYFAASIQSAMRQARDEFGDDVILVDSRNTAPELRHLGEYELVVALQHSQPEPSPPSDVTSKGFAKILADQVDPARPTQRPDRDATIKEIEASLLQIGLEPQMVKAFTTVIQDCVATEATGRFQKVPSARFFPMPNPTPQYAIPIPSRATQERRSRSDTRRASRAPALSSLVRLMAASGLGRMIQRTGT